MEPRVTVVLPCLNEIESVAAVVRETAAVLDAARVAGEVIVVDNGSTDGSAIAAAEAGARVVTERRRGYGQAYLAGFAVARGSYIVMADADGSYDLRAIPAFLEALDRGHDLVMGSRFHGRIAPGAMPWLHRYVGSPALSGILNLFYGTGVDDAHCGMRAFRRDVLPQLRLRMPGMEFASEMIVNAARAGLSVGEIPVDYRVRAGRSKLNTMRDGWRHLRFLLLYSPTHLFLIPGGIMSVVGFALLLLLLPGPITIGAFYFGIHYMVLGALFALLGAQIVALGLYAKTIAVALGLQQIDRTLGAFRRVFSLERGLGAGIVLFAAGFGVDARIAIRWAASGFGALNDVHPALFALAAMVLGLQFTFSSLFLSLIDLHVGRQTSPQ
ncbi:MAG: glycosyltransferase family 2 protein [Chloroflexota bacterium]|nr:glycosyltransferase family 2 protein [Chloroflexota bacterium]